MNQDPKENRRNRVNKMKEQDDKRRELELMQMTGGIGKIPPQAVDLEEAVIGAVLLEQSEFTERVLTEILAPEDFYLDKHQRIWKRAQDMFKIREAIDILTMTHKLRSTGELELVGGPLYISQLTNRVASAANIEVHARIIRQKSMARSIIRVAGGLIRDAYDETIDIFDLLEKAYKELGDATEVKSMKVASNMHDATMGVINSLDTPVSSDGLTGIDTGLHKLNSSTSGWQEGDLIVVGARPSMGKTAQMCSSAVASAQSGTPVAIFSLEMSTTQIAQRLIAAKDKKPLEMFKSGHMRTDALVYVKTKFMSYAGLPIYIDDTPGVSVYELRSKARRLVKDYGVKIIYIDYIQLMTASGSKADRAQFGNKAGNREQEISEISRTLKLIAKELKIPIVAYSQLSRKVEDRASKRPLLSDLRESGSLEQDADAVLFLYRPEYYGIETDDAGNSTSAKGYIMIGKYRNGAVDLEGLSFTFVGKYGLWIDESEAAALALEPGFTNAAQYKPNNNFIQNIEPALGSETNSNNTDTPF